MRNTWDPQQPVETLFNQIQECVDYAEDGGVTIGPAQQTSVAYTTIFSTGNFTSACRRWNEKEEVDKTWNNVKTHFTAAHRQRKQMQGESAATYG
jgi:hypothetical protein